MLTNHNSDNLDLVSNCNTVSTTTQHSFGIFFNSIQSFGNFIKSSGCLNFTKKTIFSRASCTASCPSLTAYQTLSSLTSPFPTVSQQLWLYMHPVSLSASVASYFNSFMIFFSSFGIFNIIPSFVISFRNCISTNIALSINLRLYDVNYFSAKIKI